MATEILTELRAPAKSRPAAPQVRSTTANVRSDLLRLIKPLASLKLTITLFIAGMILTFLGTLAQDKLGMWDVIRDYFRSWFVFVEFNILFPKSFFPALAKWQGFAILGYPIRGFWFFGGQAIGMALAANLLAAHALKFKIQAHGTRMWAGLGVIVVGVVVTTIVILAGSNPTGLQAEPMFSWGFLWNAIQVGILAITLVGIYTMVISEDRKSIEFILTAIGTGLFGAMFLILLIGGESLQLNASGMRILWQLIQGGIAGLVLLAGCVLLFKRRGGIVLIHAGIALMLFGEVFVGYYVSEERMTIEEGETVGWARDIREVELAVIDPSGPDENQVVAIPHSRLKQSYQEDSAISHEQLPFDVKVVAFHRNAEIVETKNRNLKIDDSYVPNLATAGYGLREQALIQPKRPVAGADTSGAVNMPAAYVRFLDKETGEEISTHLVSVIQSQYRRLNSLRIGSAEKVTAGEDDKQYEVYLRFKRTYKPYKITLLDVARQNYIGTNTPRHYGSSIELHDQRTGETISRRIWMNNPLRYGGETFYQSGHHEDPQRQLEVTTLQVVNNSAWMIPYVACAIVAVGLLAHFSQTLLRFLKRQLKPPPTKQNAADVFTAEAVDSREKQQDAGSSRKLPKNGSKRSPAHTPQEKLQPVGTSGEEPQALKVLGIALPYALVALFIGVLATYAVPPVKTDRGMDLYEFGRLPAVHKGRIKPLDSIARNHLRYVSNRETFVDNDDQTQPAILWLLDIMKADGSAEKHRVFRIVNLNVIKDLGLERRKHFRYAYEEFADKVPDYLEKADKLREKGRSQTLDTYERQFIVTARRIKQYHILRASFTPLDADFPTPEELKADPEAAARKLAAARDKWQSTVLQRLQHLDRLEPPLTVPVEALDIDVPTDKQWVSYPMAAALETTARLFNMQGQGRQVTVPLTPIVAAYREGDADEFNRAVAAYHADLKKWQPEHYDPGVIDAEAQLSKAQPFYVSSIFYVVAFVLAVCAWIGWSRPLNNAAFWLIVAVAVVHTLSLILRMYISGRPPVTNLYSSALFIGWGAVIAGIVVEAIFRIGVGNIVAAVGGFGSLLVAQLLALSELDTMEVLQAVLDTQFWLATHVVLITLGYTATFVAGTAGILYVVLGLLSPSLDKNLGKLLARIVYGVTCLAGCGRMTPGGVSGAGTPRRTAP